MGHLWDIGSTCGTALPTTDATTLTMIGVNSDSVNRTDGPGRRHADPKRCSKPDTRFGSGD